MSSPYSDTSTGARKKLAEERNYVQVVTLTDRLDYVASMTNNQAYCLAVEKLVGIEVPERAQYLRVIAAELQRIASHLVATGFFLQDLGALGTPLMYCFRERERILDLFEMLCGARITVSYLRPGGVYFDTPQEFWPALSRFLQDMPSYIGELEQLLIENEIILIRAKGVSPLPLERGNRLLHQRAGSESQRPRLGLAQGGPVRRLRPDGFRCPGGDQRRQSGPVLGTDSRDVPEPADHRTVRGADTRRALYGRNCPLVLRPPAGAEAYGRVEAPKGELGFYLVSDGGIAPYRCKIRSPSLLNLTVTRDLLVGWKLADMIVSLGSVDINMGEVDR